MLRAIGIAFGLANQFLFLATVGMLIVFLGASRPGSKHVHLWVDLLLALQYAVVHSWLLLPSTRRSIATRLVPALYGTFFSTVTCLQIWLVYMFWQVDSHLVWDLHGMTGGAMQIGFGASWLLLGYSMYLTGFGHQTGFTTWWAWLRRRKPAPREFKPRGLYLWLRHPIYFSFLGLLWFTPSATTDRLVLNLVWTAYIAVGSILKDQRLAHYLGAEYRRYQARVPGYPLIGFGLLGKVPLEQEKLTPMPSTNIVELPAKTNQRQITAATRP